MRKPFVVAVLSSLLLFEVGARVVCSVFPGRFRLFNSTPETVARVARGELGFSAVVNELTSKMPVYPGVSEALHPYLGFVLDPARMEGKASDYGFLGDHRGLFAEPSHSFRIGVVGGSFAQQFCSFSADTLARLLEGSPKFKSRPVEIYNLALGGYKQPQQLMTVAYFLTLGAHFDAIINVDGFNEAALAPCENIPLGVSPAFPREWAFRIAALNNDRIDPLLKRFASLGDRRRRRSRVLAAVGGTHSASLRAVWAWSDDRLASKQLRLADDIRKDSSDRLSYVKSGPPFKADRKETFVYLAKLWERSSLALQDLCAGEGISYFHFLQPNQYLENSKPMSADEKRIAINSLSPYGLCVNTAYPLFLDLSKNLKRRGVRFTDLTMVFSKHPESFYVDSCCHVSKEGYDVVAEAIAKAING